MKKLLVACLLLTGCVSKSVYTKALNEADLLARQAVATQVEQYLKDQKAKVVLDSCAQLDQHYDEMVLGVKAAILK